MRSALQKIQFTFYSAHTYISAFFYFVVNISLTLKTADFELYYLSPRDLIELK